MKKTILNTIHKLLNDSDEPDKIGLIEFIEKISHNTGNGVYISAYKGFLKFSSDIKPSKCRFRSFTFFACGQRYAMFSAFSKGGAFGSALTQLTCNFCFYF